MKKVFFILSIILLSLFVYGCGSNDRNGERVTIYKSSSCGCCVGYTGILENKGFDVEAVNVDDMFTIKNKYNIPDSMDSCHTAVIGDYFIEGHVPMEAINKLLSERPDLDGIALPDMPAGSPGMPGVKLGDFVIYGLKNGEYSEFMRI